MRRMTLREQLDALGRAVRKLGYDMKEEGKKTCLRFLPNRIEWARRTWK